MKSASKVKGVDSHRTPYLLGVKMKTNETGTIVPLDKSSTPLGWYAWYPRDFATSITVRSMSFTARAIYRELLDIQWEHGCLTSVERLLNIIGISVEQWSEFAPYVDELFPNGVNPKMDQLRNDAFNRQEQKRIAGEISAQKRRGQVQNEQPINTRSTPVEHTFNTSATKHKHNVISSKEDIKSSAKRKSFSPSDAVADATNAGILDQALLSAIEEFVQHRQEIKHPLTARAWQKIVGKLVDVAPDVAVEAINKSIASGYRDVFPNAVAKQKKLDGQTAPKIKAGAMQWFNEYQQEQARIAKARADAEAKANQKALPSGTVDMTDEEKLDLVIADE